jgi:hypothetical protein
VIEYQQAEGVRGGCPIGTLAAALADTDETFRISLIDAVDAWLEAISRRADPTARQPRARPAV